MENYFNQLNQINVSDKVEKKGQLKYLSWVWAWGQLKTKHPDAQYKVYETESGCIYWTDGKTCWVKVSVTVNAIEHIEYLPVMDFKNKSIVCADITSFDVNKAIQRALTKAIARHGLGLYIYAGEDLPEEDKKEQSAVSDKEIKELNALLTKAKVSEAHICTAVKIANIDSLDKTSYAKAINALKSKIAKDANNDNT